MTTEDLAWGFIILGLLILAYLAVYTLVMVYPTKSEDPDKQDTDEIPIGKIRLGLRAEDMGGPAKPLPPYHEDES